MNDDMIYSIIHQSAALVTGCSKHWNTCVYTLSFLWQRRQLKMFLRRFDNYAYMHCNFFFINNSSLIFAYVNFTAPFRCSICVSVLPLLHVFLPCAPNYMKLVVCLSVCLSARLLLTSWQEIEGRKSSGIPVIIRSPHIFIVTPVLCWWHIVIKYESTTQAEMSTSYSACSIFLFLGSQLSFFNLLAWMVSNIKQNKLLMHDRL